jgi:hypothetical protein
MKNKNKIIIIISALIILIAGYFIIKTNNTSDNKVNTKVEQNTKQENKSLEEGLDFLKQISGVKANNIELINNPVGLKGEFVAPRESILKGVDYFLKDTKNDKMEDIGIDIGNGYIYLRTTYKVNSFIKTPIEVKVKPSLDKEKDLVLEVSQFKFLDLNVPKWIVNLGLQNFIKDWFPDDNKFKVTFEEGKVVIDKSNYDKITIDNISIDNNAMKIDMIINLEKMVRNI